MITMDLIGRLGNQMFQIAAAIAHAKRINTTYCVPKHSFNNRIWPTYFNHLPKCSYVKLKTYAEPYFSYKEIPHQDNIRLHGYFQSAKYFDEYRDEVLKAFQFNYNPVPKGIIGVHVRRGDYLQFKDKHPPVTKAYIKESLWYFGNYYEPLFFSDDIQWCMDNFQGSFCTEPNPIKAMCLMASCEHNIISNSSFSWWAAYGNPNPDKIVIAPKIWFGPGNAHLNTKDLIPDSWIRI